MKKLLIIAAAACLGFAAQAKAPRPAATTVFSVAMSCQNCENKIKTNLRFEKGVNAIVTSLADQTVAVTYNPEKTNPEALVAAFKKLGYNAVAGAGKNPAAPAECPAECPAE